MENLAQNELRFENRWLRSQADLYSRRKGLKRWVKLGPASGAFRLDADKEYRLKFRGVLVSRVESMLQGVNCDLLAEIEVPLRAAWGDFLDQAESRVPWLDRTAEAYAARIKKALKTTAKVIANLKPR